MRSSEKYDTKLSLDDTDTIAVRDGRDEQVIRVVFDFF